ncbi:membrane protein implicated in regulation of membrane protease activity [Clostridium acetobutylicum]|uniref:Uncharacterized conserved protein (Possible membrane) n=1 Tax=Clostridium acetobutylicum (strain ATCC 824 / DSM 792 / JCM 1419 / IAM 19013 / LMG 5710 / NBRC 13948 / NRRL B-527 / VKM B-1787 / 2291 / W) TaxID=272562 RepID=Q97K68_CLOAB|nr:MULTISPECIES: NfeD family protein [Clostridium]AAK79027.1 Uncharacterized conserved protein (possible membrane) [Clostridium acetobutylicum ATCC 824]ADZ20102.1 Conserved hypothetical protein [Clostridium acetobutylicum EA 2018]AEI31579.1 hypothetical protein SMB_G1069 [Clostridium acetobutylicum DSM 1731]AWV81717.1 NfeD family protein [Clostridium acetobutylicum]MBC2395259.1 NfeD family protein [Clostridium acetobutylicum]
MNDYQKIWIIIAIFMVVIDFGTSGFLFVWFSAGAVVAIIAGLLGAPITVQIVLFAIISIALLSVGYPLSKKLLNRTVRKTPLMEEKYIGREVKAEADMEVGNSKLKVDGIYWTVKNVGEAIKKGDCFIITGIQGNKLLIRKKGEIE